MPFITISSGLSYSLPQTSHRFINHPFLLSLFIAPRRFPAGPGHLIVLGLFDALFNEFFSERLLVGRRNFRRLAAFILGDLQPSFVLGHSLGGSKIGIERLLPGQLPVSLLKISIQYLFRVAVYRGDFASALQHHFAGHRAKSTAFFGEAALLDTISFHAATYAGARHDQYSQLPSRSISSAELAGAPSFRSDRGRPRDLVRAGKWGSPDWHNWCRCQSAFHSLDNSPQKRRRGCARNRQTEVPRKRSSMRFSYCKKLR